MINRPSWSTVLRWAGRVGRVAEIEAITLRQLQWTTNELDLQVGEEPNIHPTVNIAHGVRDALLRYQVEATFTGMVAEGELFRIKSVHDVLFQLPESDSPSQDELQAYGVVTVWFMVYPYLRQELQQLTANAGLPPILLRPIRLPFSLATDDPKVGVARNDA